MPGTDIRTIFGARASGAKAVAVKVAKAESPKRRVAAIVAADVAGQTRLPIEDATGLPGIVAARKKMVATA